MSPTPGTATAFSNGQQQLLAAPSAPTTIGRADKFHEALNRTLSWDLPQHRRPHEAAVRKSLKALKPPPSTTAADEELPLPPPFKIKMVEQITLLPRPRREKLLREAGYNVFCLRSDQVFIDLLTDSGTSAMSDVQWANMMNTPQAYAGSSSFYTLEAVVHDLFGFKHVLPEHQGRAAENVLFSSLVAPLPGCFVPNNTHFDTTEANVLRCGGHPVNLAVPEAYDTALASPFKGNMDVEALEAFIEEHGPANIPVIMITVTNNSAGGQPVSMDNVRKVSAVARRHGIPLFMDAARFAENCWFIQRGEPGYRGKPLRDIARELFSYADGCTFSGKKEALANVGGLLCCNDDALYETLRNLTIVATLYIGSILAQAMPAVVLLLEDLVAMARGLMEVTDQAYQEYRHSQIELLAGLLRNAGVPIVEPPGGHAVYVDAKRFLPHIPPEQFPAQGRRAALQVRGAAVQALTAALYGVSGVRGVEIGSSCFGRIDEESGAFVPARLELMRLALPRRVYTDNHLRYVAAGLIKLYQQRDSIEGLRRVYATKLLSHFTARFVPAGQAVQEAPAAEAAAAPAGAEESSYTSSSGDGFTSSDEEVQGKQQQQQQQQQRQQQEEQGQQLAARRAAVAAAAAAATHVA
ncbi:pyridoxal phosphate-dependent transferase [Scenedesmus sp. NREL 46B-D3]|nr:pyridoxal phosphate-dependent transferase [Scenedesmus sp. NREL 46B-D3]